MKEENIWFGFLGVPDVTTISTVHSKVKGVVCFSKHSVLNRLAFRLVKGDFNSVFDIYGYA
jgi:hypothetical protein